MKQDNKYVQLLKKVRPLIASDEKKYICIALWTEGGHYDQPNTNKIRAGFGRAADEIAEFIGEGLGGLCYLESWLKNAKGIDPMLLTRKNMIAYRLRYIDHLIKIFGKLKDY